jgi:hypothetical protein
MGRSYKVGKGFNSFVGGEILETFAVPAFAAAPTTLAELTSNNQNFFTATILLLTSTSALSIESLAGADQDRKIILMLSPSSNSITLKNNSGGGTAGQLFNFGADLELVANQSVQLIATAAAGGWTIVGAAPQAGGGGAPADSTFITSTDESATLPNSLVLGGIAGAGGTAQGAMVITTGNQTIGGAANQAVVWAESVFDTGFWNSASPTVFTAPQTGLYRVSASLLWNNSASERNYMTFFHNGDASHQYGYNTQLNITNGGNQYSGTSLDVLMLMTEGDTVECIAFNQAGGTLLQSGYSTHFAINLVN